MTVEEIEAGHDGMREMLAEQAAADATELCELGNVVPSLADMLDVDAETAKVLQRHRDFMAEPDGPLPWPPQADIEDYETEYLKRVVRDNAERDLRIAARANRIADATAELGVPGVDYPEFVEINETSVYRIEREPGFPTADEVACVRMFKLVGDGREFNAGDGIEAYSVVQNRDGTYSCDCASYVFRLSKIADQRSEAARCKHARKLIQIGVFK